MADNVQANASTTSGAVFRAFSDGTNEWPATVVAYVAGGSAGAWTIQQIDATHGLPTTILAGSATIGAVTQSGTWNVTVNAALAAGTNTIGNTVPVAGTSGGATAYSYLAAGAANQDSQSVKGSAGTVYSISGFNTNSTPVYLKLYNKATGPTSADTPAYRLMIPGNTSGAGFIMPLPVGLAFGTGIGLRITGGLADNDTTAVSSGCAINLGYA